MGLGDSFEFLCMFPGFGVECVSAFGRAGLPAVHRELCEGGWGRVDRCSDLGEGESWVKGKRLGRRLFWGVTLSLSRTLSRTHFSTDPYGADFEGRCWLFLGIYVLPMFSFFFSFCDGLVTIYSSLLMFSFVFFFRRGVFFLKLMSW